MRIVAIDSGTTATRAWAVEDGAVLDTERQLGGARDVARGRGRAWLMQHITQVAEQVVRRCGGWETFDRAIAFGMLTSEHGVSEVARLKAPVAVSTLAASLAPGPDGVVPVPFELVPGVLCEGSDATTSDFMRGEETEVAGLLASIRPPLPLLYVSPGSHSKFVAVDPRGRISWSVTTLSGELLWALSQETLLAGLASTGIEQPDLEAAQAGAATEQQQGLSRTLYATRLHDRLSGMSPHACASFVLGAIAASDLQALTAAAERSLALPERVVISGSGGFAAVYHHLLTAAPWAQRVDQLDTQFGPIGAWALARASSIDTAENSPSEAQEAQY